MSIHVIISSDMRIMTSMRAVCCSRLCQDINTVGESVSMTLALRAPSKRGIAHKTHKIRKSISNLPVCRKSIEICMDIRQEIPLTTKSYLINFM